MAGVDPRQHQPQLLQQSIKSELAGWSLGKFSRMNFWRRGHRFGETPKTTSIMKYTGEDILQNGILDVESRLGEGGMGQVFLARNKEDGTTVAVKVGKDGLDRTGIKSQLAEIIARDRLPGDGHENLVKSYGFCDRAPGCPIFLEACNGGDLFEAAVEGHLMKNVEVLGLVQDVVSALDFLHEHGIIHCDVKAENILLQANGKGGYTPKLTDFGGAMAAGEERQGGGTFGYTAPEVIFGTRPAHSSQDAWAVGHMLLVMLTKRQHRASNMFKHSRLLTEADHELKATMTILGEEDLLERYLTFRNMRDLSTRDTLLSKDVFDEDLAKLPEVFSGIRQLLHLEAAERPPMAVVHGWLGLVTTGLNDTMETCRSSPRHTPDGSSSRGRVLDLPANTSTSAGIRAEARLAAPAGYRTTCAKGKPFVPPPPGFPVMGIIKNEPHLHPPPGFPRMGAKNEPYFSPPPAEDVAATHQAHAAHLSLGNESPEAVGAENEARIQTSTAHCGEIESCPSTTSTVAETEDLAAFASKLEKLSDLSPREHDAPVSARHNSADEPAIAVCPTDGDVLAAAEAAAKAAQRARNNSGAYHDDNSVVERCSRPRTAVLGMSFPAAIRQYDVTPRASDAAFCGIGQQHAAPTTKKVHDGGIPQVFQATNAAAVPPPAYYRGAPPSSAVRGHQRVSTGFGAVGGPLSRSPPPSWAARWPGQAGGYGRWTGQVAGVRGVAWQEVNMFPSRCQIDGVQEYWQQRQGPSPVRKNSHHHRHHHHHHHHHHIDSTMRTEVPGKSRVKKSKNRRGGHQNRRSGLPQQTACCGDVLGCHAGLNVPHAIAVNGAAFYPGGGGFYPWQWQRHPAGAW